ncbi:uncharacterized protein TRIADDRAFT_62666 [Trichoplax adhaerens]|uniref:Uncharacterized protein n=1 Tax=Trichoplax adhaerens TaxID=10228 RepID=B3SEH7_TRIAD|nr:predicted protein [Trichoplax adhaerens]EDV18868.1 predicted protein [Trichoplax adhaerens]|eukprot:XP_002118646.1 predicted protein [Trichoplax adhaerens]
MEETVVEDEYPFVLECEKYYEIIVKNIGRKWLALGNEVCKDHATYCYEVMDSFYTFESRASYMLYYGKVVNKTFKELLEIMIKIGCRDIAEQLQYLLQHIPIISNHHNVLYKEFTKNIGKQLKRIDQDGGHILIHGGVGSGKTTAVCQSIQRAIENEGCFKFYSCYWLRIGTVTYTYIQNILMPDPLGHE